MKTFIAILTLVTAIWAHAGDMSEIDLITRETVANAYYLGEDNDGYMEYMYNEIWDMELTDGIEGKCLVTVSGKATTYFNAQTGINSFVVCINRIDHRDFSAYMLSESVLE